MCGGEESVAMEIGWLQRSGVSGEESELGYTTNRLSSASGYTTLCGGYGERAEKDHEDLLPRKGERHIGDNEAH
jgi:hypothetical protein